MGLHLAASYKWNQAVLSFCDKGSLAGQELEAGTRLGWVQGLPLGCGPGNKLPWPGKWAALGSGPSWELSPTPHAVLVWILPFLIPATCSLPKAPGGWHCSPVPADAPQAGWPSLRPHVPASLPTLPHRFEASPSGGVTARLLLTHLGVCRASPVGLVL